jgi:tetratricopeptide (TPR) repeat protein
VLEALAMLDEQVLSHPEDPRYQSSRGIVLAKLGRNEEAVRAGKRATELFPLSADAVYAQPYVLDLAHIYLLIGDYDSACRELGLLLSIPGFYSLPLFDSDPRWVDLRDRPCYQQLVEDSATPS